MTPLILLPGMMCDERLFTPQIDAFSGERDVLVFVLSDHSTIADLATDILAHSPDRFALLGLSMGGIVAMEILLLKLTKLNNGVNRNWIQLNKVDCAM